MSMILGSAFTSDWIESSETSFMFFWESGVRFFMIGAESFLFVRVGGPTIKVSDSDRDTGNMDSFFFDVVTAS